MKKLSVLLLSVVAMFLLAGTATALTIGNDIIDRNSLDGATNIAFIDPTLVFPTAGTLESWDMWLTADVGDDWAVQIYRYTGSDYDWELVYSQEWWLSSAPGGSADVAINLSATSFQIEAGDVVGWWFGDAGGVIPFTFSGSDEVGWSNYIAQQYYNPQVGDIIDFETSWALSSQNREYSIAANYSPAPVPEPATLLLLGTGLVGLAGAGRKKLFKK